MYFGELIFNIMEKKACHPQNLQIHKSSWESILFPEIQITDFSHAKKRDCLPSGVIYRYMYPVNLFPFLQTEDNVKL